MPDLPPDLEALGDALTRATERAGARRRHRIGMRRRLPASVAAGLAVFAAMTPSRLASADQVPLLRQFTTAPAVASGPGCDRPRGHGGYLPQGCEGAEPQPRAAR